MRFEWDEAKNRRNLAKHKVSLETAKLIFDEEGEERWQTLGMVSGVVLLVPTHIGTRRRGDSPDFGPEGGCT
jgi:uncharacterized protein